VLKKRVDRHHRHHLDEEDENGLLLHNRNRFIGFREALGGGGKISLSLRSIIIWNLSVYLSCFAMAGFCCVSYVSNENIHTGAGCISDDNQSKHE